MTWFWLAWLGAFAVAEGLALHSTRTGDTLSENVWRWFKTGPDAVPGRYAWTWRTFTLGAFLTWLTLHLTLGWFAG